MTPIWPGDEIDGKYKVQRMVAYRGKKGCMDLWCTVGPGSPESCYGWHCSLCDARCNMMGHHDCPRAEDVAA